MDDKGVLDAIDSYMKRLALIEQTQNLLDSPERLRTVGQVVISTTGQKRLDLICADVCSIAGVPISAVTVIDQERQRVLGVHGDDPANMNHHRDKSLCMFVAASGHSFDLNHLTDQERLACFPVTNKKVRAYLGSPVKIENLTVGALCVLDYKPREWSPYVRELLETYASKVSQILEEERYERSGDI